MTDFSFLVTSDRIYRDESRQFFSLYSLRLAFNRYLRKRVAKSSKFSYRVEKGTIFVVSYILLADKRKLDRIYFHKIVKLLNKSYRGDKIIFYVTRCKVECLFYIMYSVDLTGTISAVSLRYRVKYTVITLSCTLLTNVGRTRPMI